MPSLSKKELITLMNNRPLRTSLLLALLVTTSFFINTRTHAAPISYLASSIFCIVTASEYADFLNQTASTDQEHFYPETMKNDISAASIIRLGKPGSYVYQVIAGRENLPVFYLNENDRNPFCDRVLAMQPATKENTEPFLASNHLDFRIALQNEASHLSMIPFGGFSTAGVISEETLETVSLPALLIILLGEVRLGRFQSSEIQRSNTTEPAYHPLPQEDSIEPPTPQRRDPLSETSTRYRTASFHLRNFDQTIYCTELFCSLAQKICSSTYSLLSQEENNEPDESASLLATPTSTYREYGSLN